MPSEVRVPLEVAFPRIETLLAIPELKVPLPPVSGRKSQNDLWVLAKSGSDLISIAVEGKVDESFDKPMSQWLADPVSPGKAERWAFLKDKLELEKTDLGGDLRYQLFHRAVSAILMAEKFNARHAVMVIHSFSASAAWFSDYAAFLKLFGLDAAKAEIQTSKSKSAIPLHFLWATGANSLASTIPVGL